VKTTAEWFSTRGKSAPELPIIVVDQEIRFLPRHPIFASSICYEMASVINRSLIGIIGTEGIVYSAAFHSLLSDAPIRVDGVKTMQALINWILSSRYRVKNLSAKECSTILRKLNKWDICRERFQTLYPSSSRLQRQKS
jgi:hypothetical protein